MHSSKEYLESVFKIYHLLQDKESKWTYLNRLNYLITEDIYYIHEITRYKYPKHFEKLKEFCENATELIVYGAGYFCPYTVEACIRYGNRAPRFICDSDSAKWNTVGVKGTEIISPNALRKEHADASIVVASFIYGNDIKLELSDVFDDDHIFVFGQKPEQEMARQQYFPLDIIKYDNKGERFVDGGTYDFNTSLRLAELAHIDKVYAFEADKMNEDKVRKNMELHQDINSELFMKGLWNKEDILYFDSGDRKK